MCEIGISFIVLSARQVRAYASGNSLYSIKIILSCARKAIFSLEFYLSLTKTRDHNSFFIIFGFHSYSKS